jgi:heme exporter protein C
MSSLVRWWGRRGTTVLGALTVVSLAVLVALGLFISDPDRMQRDAVRLMYLHVPAAWIAYLAYGVTSLASALYLWKRTRSLAWDTLAGASAEIGVLFTGLALVAGSIWAKPTWGVWWTWEPRLITTAVMFIMYVGYLLLRSLSTDVEGRATRAAVIGIVAVVNVPIVHLSVTWMNALHQLPSVLRPGGPALDERMLATLIVSVVAFTVVYVWMVVARVEIETTRQERLLASERR